MIILHESYIGQFDKLWREKKIASRSNLRWIIWFQTSDTFFSFGIFFLLLFIGLRNIKWISNFQSSWTHRVKFFSRGFAKSNANFNVIL